MSANEKAVKKNPRVGGLLLGSTDPQRLWEWYRAAFAPGEGEKEPVFALQLGNDYVIFEQRDDVGAKAAEPGRIIVNFEVDDIRAAEEHLNGVLAVRWIRPVTDMDGEVFLATVEDPDGNYVQIYQVQGQAQSGDGAGAGAA